MRNGTGRIIFWSLASVVGGTMIARKLGLRVPGLNSN
jgi:hypothetical protein